MKTLSCAAHACTHWVALFACCFEPELAAQSSPKLSIQVAANARVEIRWPAAGDFQLEAATSLAQPTVWQPIGEVPAVQGTEAVLLHDASQGQRYFRLAAAPAALALTTIAQSSPVDGETGVAVTRETILRFTRSLAASTVLTTNHFHAGFGGRRLLSRVELSSDRKTATLFYLEPLPGSTRVYAVFDGNDLKDATGLALDADGDGLPGGQVLIGFDTLSLTPLVGTAVIGRVFASELVPGSDTGTNALNKPLPGVTITVDGMEQSIRTVTDAQGNFTLNNCPPGRFFVHIDGRTVTDSAAGIHYPDKAYYPFVGKAWDAVAGRTDNKAGGTGVIYLPLIKAGTLQTVSATEDTTIRFPADIVQKNPALAGVTITVPANALFNDNGTRGGKVGIAPVPPDRLPGPLPSGLELPIVITVQTDGGLNFDRPAPICFPNLPDPVLKTPLPANSKQALISFNHDKGIWEAVGSMTVSADGKFICTDPGAGILQPGWHGVGPDPDDPPPCGELPCCPDDDDAPLGAASLAAGDQGSGRLRQASPPLPTCKKKRCKDKLAACKKKCSDDLEICYQVVHRLGIQCKRQLKSMGCHTNFTDKCNFAAIKCEESERNSRNLCFKDWEDCNEDCRRTCTDAALSQFARASAEGVIVGEIEKRMNEFDALMEPYQLPGSEVPREVWTRIFQLLDEADAIAGGDAVEFLNDYIVRLEGELLAAEDEFDEDLGNAPPYPVLFAAEIARGDDRLTLRGETQPFGQYSLFTPRDGELLSMSFYDPRTKRFGMAFPRLRPEAPHQMRRFTLRPVDESFSDSDLDGLVDSVEFVYGTDETVPDSDGDGILDGAETDQGTNPLDGRPIRIGIIATVKTPGPAVDVWAGNDLVVTAEGAAGVSIFNAFEGLGPTLISHVPVTGNAQRLAGDSNLIGIAAGEGGLTILDISTPAGPRILHELRFGNVQAVTAGHRTFFAGSASGLILAIDATSGLLIDRVKLPDPVQDLGVSGDTLYAITPSQLCAIPLNAGSLAVAKFLPTKGTGSNQRLFVGGGLAYSVHVAGYNTFSLTDPAQPVALGVGDTQQVGWRQIVPNGSGLGLAVVGPNSRDEPARDLYLHDVSDPRRNDVFLTLLATPGVARAVTIFNGLAYVADDTAGLQVINYLAYDSKGVPPTISLGTSATGGVITAPSRLRMTANATDDVQVRNVEFYIDGQRASSDGNFPFEHWFITPSPTAAKTNLTLRARAIDTGGNATWSAELVLKLEPDTTPPHVVAVTPEVGSRTLNRLGVLFSESMSSASINEGSFRLISPGPDGQLDTADDAAVSGGVIAYDDASRTASLDFTASVPDGLYRAAVTSSVMDLSGNHPASDFNWVIRVADAVFWISRIDGFWENPSNWSTGAVPGPDDNVIIDIPNKNLMITLSIGDQRIKSLIAHERMMLMTGSGLEGPGGMQLSQSLTLNGGTIRNSTVTLGAGAKLFCANNAMNTFDRMRIEGDLVLTNTSTRALIRNGLSITGSVVLDNASAITFAGNQTFNGGQVVFASGLSVLGIEPGTTLTLGPSTVVRGKSGNIGQAVFASSETRKLINQGLIAADVAGGTFTIGPSQLENAGTIECKNGGSVTLLVGDGTGSGARSTGLIKASGAGKLTFERRWKNSGTITANETTVNLGGTFALADLGTFNRTGGTVNLTGVLDLGGGILTLDAATGPWAMTGGTLKGGTVRQTGGARLVFAAFNALNTFDGMRVEGDLVLTNASTRALIRNGLSITGSVVLDNASAITFAGDQTFNTGQVVFAGTLGVLGIEPGTTLTLGSSMVVRGKSGNVGQGVFASSGTRKLINQGLIAADVAGSTITILPVQFENPGTLRADGAGAKVVIRVTPFTNTGTIQERNGGKVLINP